MTQLTASKIAMGALVVLYVIANIVRCIHVSRSEAPQAGKVFSGVILGTLENWASACQRAINRR